MFFSLAVLVDHAVLNFTGRKVDVADIKRNLIVLIEVFPDVVEELIDIVRDGDTFRLSLECRNGVAVCDIGMDKMSESGNGLIDIGVAVADRALGVTTL